MYHSLFDDQLNLTYGRLSATDDFLTSPLYCQFVSNAICGQPAAPFFNMPNGITAYPGATWGARARYHVPVRNLLDGRRLRRRSGAGEPQ